MIQLISHGQIVIIIKRSYVDILSNTVVTKKKAWMCILLLCNYFNNLFPGDRAASSRLCTVERAGK